MAEVELDVVESVKVNEKFLSELLKVRIPDRNHIEFVYVPLDRKIKEKGFSFVKFLWDNLLEQMDELTQALRSRTVLEPRTLYLSKCSEVKECGDGWFVRIAPFTREGKPKYYNGVKFMEDAWEELVKQKDWINKYFAQLQGESEASEEEGKLKKRKEAEVLPPTSQQQQSASKKKKPVVYLSYSWSWKGVASKCPAFFSKEDATEDAVSDPDILEDVAALKVFEMSCEEPPYTAKEFLKYAYCFLLGNICMEQYKKNFGPENCQAEDLNAYVSQVQVPTKWVQKFCDQFFMAQGCPTRKMGMVFIMSALADLTSFAKEKLAVTLALDGEDRAEFQGFYKLCRRVWKILLQEIGAKGANKAFCFLNDKLFQEEKENKKKVVKRGISVISRCEEEEMEIQSEEEEQSKKEKEEKQGSTSSTASPVVMGSKMKKEEESPPSSATVSAAAMATRPSLPVLSLQIPSPPGFFEVDGESSEPEQPRIFLAADPEEPEEPGSQESVSFLNL